MARKRWFDDALTGTKAEEDLEGVEVARDAARHFLRKLKKKGDLEDLTSMAEEAWLRAVRTWVEKNGPLEPWIWRCVRNHLFTRQADEVRRGRLLPRVPLEDQEERKRFSLSEFFSNLSDEAAEVAAMVFEIPGTRSDFKRDELVRVLFRRGWSSRTILEAFREIREALT